MKPEDFGFGKVVSLDDARKAKEQPQPAPVVDYIKLAANMTKEEFVNQFQTDENGRQIVPSEFIRQVLEASAMRLITLKMKNFDTMQDEEIDAVMDPLEEAASIFLGEKQGDLSKYLEAGLKAIDELGKKYG